LLGALLPSILVCDDERSLCQVLEIDLRKEGYRVETVNTRSEAARKIETAIYDVIVTDIRMPQTEDGMEVLRHARRVSPDSAIILMTAVAELETAILAVKNGAFDYIVKQPGRVNEEVKLAIARALETLELRRQNLAFRRDAGTRNSLEQMVSCSAAMDQLKQTIRTIAPTNSTVLITGESGTGKELVARAIHSCSPRSNQPFVSINCGAFPETLLESELFGYVKGAFTGANQNKPGLFEVADGGTVFLDEISEMSVAMQVKLLRVLQERTVRPIGGSSEVPFDVRVIAATNKDLSKLVSEQGFREDLYYRVSVIPIDVPPLRQRSEDILLLANVFLKRFAKQMGKSIDRISNDSVQKMRSYDWPGNVRQLENTIERGVAMEQGSVLQVQLPVEKQKSRAVAAGANGSTATVPAEGLDMENYVSDLEKSLLQSALHQSGGVQTRAADLLKLSYRSFRHLLKKYDINA